ncbi:hypothetical protein OIU79_024748 [Salix purpurea]|uniref:Uncharacterized protein n=1 Tax=Salix purpurea TaxID=77065 RepID=A0A9Q1A6I3_SALPP|nr:hypothetical protein OIU79_024748 [Salix purpurea]
MIQGSVLEVVIEEEKQIIGILLKHQPLVTLSHLSVKRFSRSRVLQNCHRGGRNKYC